MSKTTGVIIAALVITVVAIAIGYANISEKVINIEGTLQAQGDQSNFLFAFEGQPSVAEGNAGTVTATASGTSAVFSVEGLSVIGDTASATYTVKNSSVNLNATEVLAAVSKGNEGYFETTVTQPADTELAPGESSTVTVTTKLIKAPINPVEQEVVVTISATPTEVQ